MAIKKKTVLNILLMLFVLSFFITPVGHYGKLLLNRIFSFSPSNTEIADRKQIDNYDWVLKDAEWNFFNFKKSKGKVVFINFWASWRLPSEAELKSIQALYDRYQNDIDFYIITNENREPVETFMEKKDFDFPVTYLIIGNEAPFKIPEPPYSYLIDKEGFIVIEKDGVANWDNPKVYQTIESLLKD